MASPQLWNPGFKPATVNSGSFTSGTSVTVSSTGSVTNGSLQVVILTVGGATAPSALSPPAGGWTTFLTTTANTSAGLIVTAIFYLKAASTAAFSGSFTWTTTATSGRWAFMEFAGEGASLVDGTVATSQNASGTKTSPSVTPSGGQTNDLLVCSIIGAVVGTDTLTIPAGMSSLFGLAGSASQPFFYGASLALGSTAATGTKTWTIPTSRTCLGISFLIQQGAIIPGESPQIFENAARPMPKAIGEPFPNLFTSVLNVQPQNTTDLFRTPVFARLPDPRPPVRQEFPANLLPIQSAPVVTVTFSQDDWPNAAKPSAKAAELPITPSAPLLTPNPAQPWAQYDWPSIRTTAKAKIDDPYNLTIELPSGIAVAPPFNQDLWENPARTFPKATGEYNQSIFVVTAAFNQPDWLQPAIKLQKAKADDFAYLVPLYSVVVPAAPPFNQDLWDNAARTPPRAVGEATAGNAPLLTPNPARPFAQSDWLRAPPTLKGKVDDVVNLLPIQSIVVVVSPPFAQSDWPLTATLRPKITDNSLAELSPLYSPNPAQPWAQYDWPRTHDQIRSDTGFGFGLNPNLPPPLPLILWAQSVT